MSIPAFPTTGALVDFDYRDVVLTDGKVSQENDLSGNNRHATQSDASKRPWYLTGAGGYNSYCQGVFYPFMYPNYLTAQDIFTEVPTSSFTYNVKDSTMYFVGAVTSDRSHRTNGSLIIASTHNGVDWDGDTGLVSAATGLLYNLLQSSTVGFRPSPFVLPSSTFVLAIRFRSGSAPNVTFNLNGIKHNITGSLFNVNMSGLRLGWGRFSNSQWFGSRKRFVLFNTAHSDAVMDSNVAWLMSKFNVAMRRLIMIRGDSHAQGGQPGQVMSWPYFIPWKYGDVVYCFTRGGKRLRDVSPGIGGEGSIYDEYPNTVGQVLSTFSSVTWESIIQIIHGSANDETFIDPNGNTNAGLTDWINPTAQTYLGVNTVESIARQTTYATAGSANQRSVLKRLFDACQQAIAAGHDTYYITQPPRWTDFSPRVWRYNGHEALNEIIRLSPESDRGKLIDAGGDIRFASNWPVKYWETDNGNLHPSEIAQKEIIAPYVMEALKLSTKRSKAYWNLALEEGENNV